MKRESPAINAVNSIAKEIQVGCNPILPCLPPRQPRFQKDWTHLPVTFEFKKENSSKLNLEPAHDTSDPTLYLLVSVLARPLYSSLLSKGGSLFIPALLSSADCCYCCSSCCSSPSRSLGSSLLATDYRTCTTRYLLTHDLKRITLHTKTSPLVRLLIPPNQQPNGFFGSPQARQ